ncbi:hypothetical protein PCL_09886 [Purpureocillium lilacinum]|uniref:Uncharacterized protein n=1 Tax=Purpureocillium lilacinum TaxID=33203 RepID=A0A2U3EEC6_PURLI|nr:hypothetical protein PCL_09886 [Purpureocillium lilacinum]
MSQNAPLALQGTVKSSAKLPCPFSRLSTPGNDFHAGPLPPPGSPVSRKRPGQAAFLLDRQPFTPHPTLSHYACFPGPDLAYLASPGVLWGAVALYVGYVRRPDDGKLGCISGHTGRHSADGLAGSTDPERRAKEKGTPEECWRLTPLFYASFHMASAAASCWLVRPGSGHGIGPCWFGSKDWSDSAKSTQSTHKPQSPALRALGCILHAALGREDKLRGTLDGMSGDTPDSPLYIIRMAALGVVKTVAAPNDKGTEISLLDVPVNSTQTPLVSLSVPRGLGARPHASPRTTAAGKSVPDGRKRVCSSGARPCSKVSPSMVAERCYRWWRPGNVPGDSPRRRAVCAPDLGKKDGPLVLPVRHPLLRASGSAGDDGAFCFFLFWMRWGRRWWCQSQQPIANQKSTTTWRKGGGVASRTWIPRIGAPLRNRASPVD